MKVAEAEMKQLGPPQLVMYTKEPGASREVITIVTNIFLLLIIIIIITIIIAIIIIITITRLIPQSSDSRAYKVSKPHQEVRHLNIKKELNSKYIFQIQNSPSTARTFGSSPYQA